jgi:hypothetical protein
MRCMEISPTVLWRRLLRAGAGVLLLTTVNCAQLPLTSSVAIPPIPSGEARVWFYRALNPYDSHATPYVRMNDTIIGISQPMGASYRDVPAGHYHVAVDSYLRDSKQTRDVDLVAGEQVYFKIVSEQFACNGGGSGESGGGADCARENFYVRTMPAEIAQGDVARSPFHGGG